MRPLGEITGDLEKLFEEMVDDHDLQHGEVLALCYVWLSIHRPGAREHYIDGGHPIFYYGPENKDD